VRELNLTTMYAIVEPFTGDWYTQAKKETMTQIVEPRRVEWRLGMELAQTFPHPRLDEEALCFRLDLK